MILRPDRLFVRLVVIGALAAALAGCGRKSGLDLPPGAAAESGAAASKPTESQTLLGGMSGRDSSKPSAPSNVPKKRIPLDVLLN